MGRPGSNIVLFQNSVKKYIPHGTQQYGMVGDLLCLATASQHVYGRLALQSFSERPGIFPIEKFIRSA